MKCQLKYRWVKLPRACLPQGKGVLGHWARLAARAAYRKGIGTYCGFENEVLPGMWAGGVVGLKSILGTRSRREVLETLERLQELGYLSYSLDPATKKLELLIREHKMLHEHNTCARYCFGNVRCAVDGNENMKPMKNQSRGRIDITVAWIIAMAAAMLKEQQKPDLAEVMRTRNYHL